MTPPSEEDNNGPSQRGYRSGGGLVPIPDPTKLTIDAVATARVEIEKLFDTKVNALHLDVSRLAAIIAELPNLDRERRRDFEKLLEQKFVGVATEFTMRDIALAAAFKAAEAAVAQQNQSNTLAIEKAGAAFTKQIDGLDEKIDDIKSRLSELSGKNYAAIGAYIVGAFGIAALIITVLLKAHVTQ